jgi:membrane peptidoglycan carboxypeptidase
MHARTLPAEKAEEPRWDDVHWLNAPFVKRVTEGVSAEDVVVNVGPGVAAYIPLHDMPGYVGGAAYLSEEMDFYDDGPINLNLINKAVRLNLEKGRFQYGGSTVTQQLVKNLFLTRDKTFARKFQEALISWRITDVVSKKRVLELYLNCIEYGPDVYGIGPAAQFYFQKDARLLSAKEAIFLAMLKPAPWYGAKVVERGKTPVTGWWAGRYEELYQRLIDYGYLTRAQADAEKPYVLEWDKKTGKYEAAVSNSVPVFGIEDDLFDLLDVDPQ